jgi:lysophospholipase L1-like esterase
VRTRLQRRALWAAHDGLARLIRPRAVFLGDSITYEWLEHAPDFFLRHRRMNAGIGGQTTRDMLARFDADVIARAPRIVHIMAGTNDLWHGDPGPDAAIAIDNLAEMVRRAQTAGIAVILAAPPPISKDAARLFGRPELFPTLLDGIAQLAAPSKVLHVDYATSLGDGRGGIKPELTTDGVHLTRAGYRAMREQAERALLLLPQA